MKTLVIRKYPQKILKQKAAIVSRITPGVQKLIPQMIETMYKNDGIGLAAPQIGVSKRIIIVESSTHPHDKGEETHNDAPLQEGPLQRVETHREQGSREQGKPSTRASAVLGKPLAFLNPVITKKSRKVTSEEEGCLSLPGIFVPVKRAETVELTCRTPQGEEVKVQAQGLIARIFQHEVDHLNGRLIINSISPVKRFKIEKQLKELKKKGKVSA